MFNKTGAYTCSAPISGELIDAVGRSNLTEQVRDMLGNFWAVDCQEILSDGRAYVILKIGDLEWSAFGDMHNCYHARQRYEISLLDWRKAGIYEYVHGHEGGIVDESPHLAQNGSRFVLRKLHKNYAWLRVS